VRSVTGSWAGDVYLGSFRPWAIRGVEGSAAWRCGMGKWLYECGRADMICRRSERVACW
jgi:hypothetical protein